MEIATQCVQKQKGKGTGGWDSVATSFCLLGLPTFPKFTFFSPRHDYSRIEEANYYPDPDGDCHPKVQKPKGKGTRPLRKFLDSSVDTCFCISSTAHQAQLQIATRWGNAEREGHFVTNSF